MKPGDRIGHYQIDHELATDSTGVIYRALHLVLPRRAIIKVMHAASVYPRVIQQPLAIHVLREACILEALHHPGIVRLYESGMLSDRRPWFARELVEGTTLASLMEPGPSEASVVLSVLRDLSEVLDHAYRRGIIHCGLRPDRVVLTGPARGFPLCITDWTDARAHDSNPTPYFSSPAAWHYTSPELACGEPIDDRTDVFALGVIAYQMLTGALPFDEVGHELEARRQHVPVEVGAPRAPRELTGLVDQMLAHDRRERPSSAEVYADLTWLAETLAAAVTPVATLVRSRRPRWTPTLTFAQPDGDERERADRSKTERATTDADEL